MPACKDYFLSLWLGHAQQLHASLASSHESPPTRQVPFKRLYAYSQLFSYYTSCRVFPISIISFCRVGKEEENPSAISRFVALSPQYDLTQCLNFHRVYCEALHNKGCVTFISEKESGSLKQTIDFRSEISIK